MAATGLYFALPSVQFDSLITTKARRHSTSMRVQRYRSSSWGQSWNNRKTAEWRVFFVEWQRTPTNFYTYFSCQPINWSTHSSLVTISKLKTRYKAPTRRWIAVQFLWLKLFSIWLSCPAVPSKQTICSELSNFVIACIMSNMLYVAHSRIGRLADWGLRRNVLWYESGFIW